MFKRKSTVKEKKWLESVTNEKQILVTDSSIEEKLRLIQLDDDHLQTIVCVKPLVETHIDTLVNEFYQTILQVKELQQMITTHSTVERLRQTLRIHLIELFEGKINEAFIEKRIQVARVHYRIGLKPSWYMGAFQNLQQALFHIMMFEVTDREEFRVIWAAVTKLLSLEQQLVLEAYNEETEQKIIATFEEGQRDLQQRILQVSEGLLSISEETNASVASLVGNSRDVNNLVESSYMQARNVQLEVAEGQERLATLFQEMSQVEDDTQSMRKTVLKLEDSSKQITRVVNIVHSIAEQTNLLALNSAIEAARAGEHGKGFSVVAQEVRKLAEQTKESVKDIQALIDSSQLFTNEVAHTLERVELAVQRGANASRTTNDTFQTIRKSIEENEKNLSHMDKQMDELVNIMEDISSATTQVATSAEQLNEVTQRI